MSNIGDSERKTQNRVVKFFKNNLHYTYFGNLHDSENSNIMQKRLYEFLKSGKHTGFGYGMLLYKPENKIQEN